MKHQVLYSRIRACTLLAGLAVLVALAPSAHGQTVTIAPTSRSLAFSTSQPVGITSAAQTVTITNSGTTAVTISSIASSLLDYPQTNNLRHFFGGSRFLHGEHCLHAHRDRLAAGKTYDYR